MRRPFPSWSGAAWADKIAVLENGALVEEGTGEALLAQGGLFAPAVQNPLDRQGVERFGPVRRGTSPDARRPGARTARLTLRLHLNSVVGVVGFGAL